MKAISATGKTNYLNSTITETQPDDDTLTITRVEISDETNAKLSTLIYNEGQVTVHCKTTSPFGESCVRIWATTYLIDKKSNHRSKLLHIDGVSQYPVWTKLPLGKVLHFTLIFSALPASCKEFDFLELIPEPDGFRYPGIKRNSTDVYHVDFS